MISMMRNYVNIGLPHKPGVDDHPGRRHRGYLAGMASLGRKEQRRVKDRIGEPRMLSHACRTGTGDSLFEGIGGLSGDDYSFDHVFISPFFWTAFQSRRTDEEKEAAQPYSGSCRPPRYPVGALTIWMLSSGNALAAPIPCKRHIRIRSRQLFRRKWSCCQSSSSPDWPTYNPPSLCLSHLRF
jgi:hypothetical protein